MFFLWRNKQFYLLVFECTVTNFCTQITLYFSKLIFEINLGIFPKQLKMFQRIQKGKVNMQWVAFTIRKWVLTIITQHTLHKKISMDGSKGILNTPLFIYLFIYFIWVMQTVCLLCYSRVRENRSNHSNISFLVCFLSYCQKNIMDIGIVCRFY